MLPPGGPVNPAKRTLSAASAVQFVRSHAQVNYPNLVALVRVAASPEFMLNGVGASPRGRVFASFPRWTSLAAPSVMEAMPDGSFQTYPGRSIAHRECDSQDGQGPEDRNPGRRPPHQFPQRAFGRARRLALFPQLAGSPPAVLQLRRLEGSAAFRSVQAQDLTSSAARPFSWRRPGPRSGLGAGRNPKTFSTAIAMASNLRSLPAAASSSRPTGRPSPVRPIGTLTPGMPALDPGSVWRM